MKLTIIRERWLRGNDPSFLIDPITEKMCCLGFLGCAIGVPSETMYGVGNPGGTESRTWPGFLLTVRKTDGTTCDSKTGLLLMRINDRPEIDDNKREKKLTEIFAEYGIEVMFTNEEVQNG
jgi:hypothetical protein